MIENENNISIKDSFESVSKFSDFEITPQETQIALEDNSRYKKLEINSGQKMQISLLIQQIPQMLASDSLSKVYKVTFPKGLPHTLTDKSLSLLVLGCTLKRDYMTPHGL